MAAQLNVEDTPLPVAYERASRLANTSGSTTEALSLLEYCEQLISSAALFSSNEDKDDLQTSCIRYLLVPLLRAELLNSQTGQSPHERLQLLQAATDAYSAFLQRCHHYGFLSDAISDAYTAEEQGMQQDSSTCRSQKIERFKRSKALAGLLLQMNSRKKPADEEADGTEDGTPRGLGSWDDEDERMLWQLQIEAGAIKALDARLLIKQEMQLLEHAVKQQQQQQQQGGSNSSNSTSSLPCPTGLAATQDTSRHKAGRQQQQQMLDALAGIAGQLGLNDRQAVKQQVFRPSHILPTMTVEQQGAFELREAQRREAAAAQAAATAHARTAQQRSDDDSEEELAKARAWDDFKDDNPKGWGNSKLRPCA